MNGLTDITYDASKLKTARERVGLTQAEAARQLGIDRQRLFNYENALNDPSAEMLIKICTLYKINLSALTSKAA